MTVVAMAVKFFELQFSEQVSAEFLLLKGFLLFYD
jgi:methionine-rich copper-binding protein CopC